MGKRFRRTGWLTRAGEIYYQHLGQGRAVRISGVSGEACIARDRLMSSGKERLTIAAGLVARFMIDDDAV